MMMVMTIRINFARRSNVSEDDGDDLLCRLWYFTYPCFTYGTFSSITELDKLINEVIRIRPICDVDLHTYVA